MQANTEVSVGADAHGQARGTTSEAVTVVVADDDRSARADLRRSLEYHGIVVVAEAADAADAVATVVRLRPQVCLLKVDLPGDGIAASDEIYAQVPDTRIAILSNSEDDVLRAIGAGADGYVLNDVPPHALAAALRAVARGEAALPRDLTAGLIDELRKRVRQESKEHLTQEERRQRLAQQHLARQGHDLTVGGHPPLSWRLLYVPRLARHFRHRWPSAMSTREAWTSAKARARQYR